MNITDYKETQLFSSKVDDDSQTMLWYTLWSDTHSNGDSQVKWRQHVYFKLSETHGPSQTVPQFSVTGQIKLVW